MRSVSILVPEIFEPDNFQKFSTEPGASDFVSQKVVNRFPSDQLNKRKGGGCDSASHFNAHRTDRPAHKNDGWPGHGALQFLRFRPGPDC